MTLMSCSSNRPTDTLVNKDTLEEISKEPSSSIIQDHSYSSLSVPGENIYPHVPSSYLGVKVSLSDEPHDFSSIDKEELLLKELVISNLSDPTAIEEKPGFKSDYKDLTVEILEESEDIEVLEVEEEKSYPLPVLKPVQLEEVAEVVQEESPEIKEEVALLIQDEILETRPVPVLKPVKIEKEVEEVVQDEILEIKEDIIVSEEVEEEEVLREEEVATLTQEEIFEAYPTPKLKPEVKDLEVLKPERSVILGLFQEEEEEEENCFLWGAFCSPKAEEELTIPVVHLFPEVDITKEPVKASVEEYIEYWTKYPDIQKLIEKSYAYHGVMMGPILMDAGMDSDFAYMAFAESNYNHRIKNPDSGATGCWQFMKSAARSHGLTVRGDTDERTNCEKSTWAAVSYLKTSYEQLGDWLLSIAAFNCGDRCVENAIKAAGGERDFFKLASMPRRNRTNKHLPMQTRRYIYKILAAKEIAENPENITLKPVSTSKWFLDTLKTD